MRIGIDIDDVITDTSVVIEELIESDSNSSKLREHLGHIMKGDPSDPEVVAFCMKNYIRVFQKAKIKNNASKVVNSLLASGNEVVLITARGDKLDCFRGSERITKEFLKKNGVGYTEILFNATDKARLCLDNHIDLMVDDSVGYCEDVEKAGIKSILFTSRVNHDVVTDIERVSDWLELEGKIKEITRNYY